MTLQLLKKVTSYRITALPKMGWTTAIPLATTINPAKGTNTKTSPQVDFPCHRSSSNVVPIRIIRCKLFKCTSLHNISPRWKLNLAGSLEVSGVSLDELMRRNIFHGPRRLHFPSRRRQRRLLRRVSPSATTGVASWMQNGLYLGKPLISQVSPI